jgi:hypothetical protein
MEGLVSINLEDLRKHFASLSNEELLLVERDELTATAQQVFDSEFRSRRLDIDQETKEEEVGTFFRSANESPEKADWLENAFPATTFSEWGSGAVAAAEARDALLAAGIPSQVTEHEIDPSDEPVSPRHREYRVMVPGSFSLQATSVLDIAIYNRHLEEEWKTQLESLSDEEFQSLNIDAACAGLLDRVERLRKAYKREAAQRSKGASR